jgi:RNA recognition motif-containing protein
MGKTLFVGGLPYETTQEELARLFSACGKVADVKLIMDRQTGRSKGFGFVEMGTEAEARTAASKLNGSVVGQRAIFINEARPKDERPPAPKPYGPGSPGFVERRSGKDRRRQPGDFGSEKKRGAEPGRGDPWKKWVKPGGSGKPFRKPGGFRGPKRGGGRRD